MKDVTGQYEAMPWQEATLNRPCPRCNAHAGEICRMVPSSQPLLSSNKKHPVFHQVRMYGKLANSVPGGYTVDLDVDD